MGLTTEIDTIETKVRDDDRIWKHTGVCNIIQGVLLGHPIHTISYTIPQGGCIHGEALIAEHETISG
jgi:hypothetical protein